MKSSREVRRLLGVSLFLARIPGTTGLLVLPNSSYFPAHTVIGRTLLPLPAHRSRHDCIITGGRTCRRG